MKFIDNEHKRFYNEKCNEILQYRSLTSNHKAFIYTIGICNDTRNNFKQIYNMKQNRINIEAFNRPWQTSGSIRICRLAFNLLNGFCYNSDEDIENDKVSSAYTVDNIFDCGYAPYFFTAICIRYPAYTGNQF